MNYSDLKKRMAEKKKIPNLMIFTGEERELMLKVAKRFDAKTVEDIEQLPSMMLGGSLFGNTKKTFLVKDAKKILKWELEKLQNITKTHRLIILCEALDKRSKLAKAVEVVEFPKPGTDALVGLITARLKGRISAGDAAVLVHCCENNLARLNNELHKLHHFDGPLTYETITDIVHPPLEDAIFDMIDCIAMGSHQAEDAYSIYMDMIELGESPIKIVSLLYTKFKQIFLVQSNQAEDNATLAGKTGLTFWQVKKAREVIGRFSDWQLIQFLGFIQKAELDMKTGAVDIELAMEDLLIKILEG